MTNSTFNDAQPAQVTDAMVERAWAAIVGNDIASMCFQIGIIRADLKTGLEAVLAAQPPAAPVETKWECMGRKQALPEPGECNWPDCGCDPHATKVIESLIEQGWQAPAHPGSSAGSEPVAWRYGRKDWGREIWRYVSSVPEFERPGDWIIEPLYGAVPQAAPVTAAAEWLEKFRRNAHNTGFLWLADEAEKHAKALRSSLTRPELGSGK